MEEKVKKLLEKHKGDKDLTSEKDYIKPGWDWSKADLSGWNLEALSLSHIETPANFYKVNLKNANLKKAYFIGANLRESDLCKADLQESDLCKADLQRTIMAYANFKKAVLSGINLENTSLYEVNLEKANLNKANLKHAVLIDCNLKEALLFGSNLQGTNLIRANLRDTDFDEKTNLRNVNFFQCRLDNSNLKNAYMNLDKKVIQERENDYSAAKEVYLLLKNYFRQEGIYDISGEYYYREKLMETKCLQKEKRWGKWIFNNLLNLTTGFGEKPLRVLICWFSIILSSALVFYYFDGIYKGAFCFYNPKFYESLYFSIVTFTTLGFGDLVPKPGFFQLFASIEALIGAIFMALFIFVFVRRMIR